MANQQLVDYIKQQLQLGVSKEAIKTALSQVGWPEAEVNDAFIAAQPVAVPAAGVEVAKTGVEVKPVEQIKPVVQEGAVRPAAAVAAAPVSPTTTPFSSTTRKEVVSPAEFTSPLAKATSPVTGAASSPRAVAKDIFQPKGEVVFQPRVQLSGGGTPAAATAATTVTTSVSAHPSVFKKYFLAVVAVVVISALGGGSAYLFLQLRSLKTAATEIQTIRASLEQANAQIASLMDEKSSLASQLEITNSEKADLLLNLSFLVAPAGEAASAEATVGGIVGTGGKGQYTLTTDRGVVLNIRNSAKPEVARALQPLVGKRVSLRGSYLPGSREITVLEVNGTAVEAVSPPEAAASTSTAP